MISHSAAMASSIQFARLYPRMTTISSLQSQLLVPPIPPSINSSSSSNSRNITVRLFNSSGNLRSPRTGSHYLHRGLTKWKVTRSWNLSALDMRKRKTPGESEMDALNRPSPGVAFDRIETDAKSKLLTYPKDCGPVFWDKPSPGPAFLLEWNRETILLGIKKPRLFMKFLWCRSTDKIRVFGQWTYFMKNYGNWWNPLTYFSKEYPTATNSKLRKITYDLYTGMNQAFATGSSTQLHDYCGLTLATNLNGRLNRRPTKEVRHWTCDKWMKPKMVGRHLAWMQEPTGGSYMMQQELIQCRSQQSLTSREVLPDESMRETVRANKFVTEYAVLHRRFYDTDLINDWFLWGFLKDEHVLTFKKFVDAEVKKEEEVKTRRKLASERHPSYNTAQKLTSP